MPTSPVRRLIFAEAMTAHTIYTYDSMEVGQARFHNVGDFSLEICGQRVEVGSGNAPFIATENEVMIKWIDFFRSDIRVSI